MKNVLFIDACARPDSRTRFLAEKVLAKLGGQTEELDLYSENLLPLTYEQLEERNRLIAAGDFSAPLFQFARQFAEADEIVIAAPYWDLSFPSVLRIYLEHTTVTGLTFRYSETGVPIGLCKAKRLIYVTTAGGPIGDRNFGFNYVEALAKTFYGIADIVCFQAENLDIWGADVPGILENAAREIENSAL